MSETNLLRVDDDGHISQGFIMKAVCFDKDLARRIVACVNALEGVATDRLEAANTAGSGFWGKCIHDADVKYSELAIKNKELTAQRDELLAALKREHATMPGYHDDEHCTVCELIRKIEGV